MIFPIRLNAEEDENTLTETETIILSHNVDEFNETYWNKTMEEFCKKPQRYQGYYPIEKIAPIKRGQSPLPVILIANQFSCDKKIFDTPTGFTRLTPIQVDLRGLPLELRNKLIGAMSSCGAFPNIYKDEQINVPEDHPSIVYLSGSVSDISFFEPDGNCLRGDQENIPRSAHFKDISATLHLSLENVNGESFWSKELDLSTENYFESNDKKNTQTVFTREVDAALTNELYEQIEDLLTEMITSISEISPTTDERLSDVDIEEKDLVPVDIVTVFKITNDKKNIDKGGRIKTKRHREIWKSHDFKLTATRSFMLLDYTIDGMQDFLPIFADRNEKGEVKAEKLKKGSEKDKGYRFRGKKTVLLYPGKHTIVVGLRIRWVGKANAFAGGLIPGVMTKVIGATMQDARIANQIKKEELSKWYSFGQYGEIEIDVKPGEPITIEAVPIYYKKQMKKGLGVFKLVQSKQ